MRRLASFFFTTFLCLHLTSVECNMSLDPKMARNSSPSITLHPTEENTADMMVIKSPTTENNKRDVEEGCSQTSGHIHHRPLHGLVEILNKVEQKLLEIEKLGDGTRMNQIEMLMAALDAHREAARRRTQLGEDKNSTVENPLFTQVFSNPRTAVGRRKKRFIDFSFADLFKSVRNMLLIFPGTIWCGAGDTAYNDTEKLGKHNETDYCCREHDLNEYIPAGKIAPEFGKIKNNYSFTSMSSCESDNEFRECLLSNIEAGSDSSEAVGYLYFSILKPKCYTKVINNSTEINEIQSRSLEDETWTTQENKDFPDPSPKNKALNAILYALSFVKSLAPNGLAESWLG